MACNLSAGRQEVCKESIGGLQGVYFLNYTTSSFTKNADGEVTALPSGSTVYYYQLKGSSTYTEAVNSSRNNGTTFFTQTTVLNLKKLIYYFELKELVSLLVINVLLHFF